MKKPEIKINFLYYGTPFDVKKNFLFKLLKKKYNVIISDKPDYVFFSVYKSNNKFLLEDGTVRLSKEVKNKKERFLRRIIRKLRKKNFVKEIIWFLKEKNILIPGYARLFEVKGNFVKIFYTCESIKPDMSKCDWAFTLCPESELNHPKHMRIPPYIMFADNFNLRKREQSFSKIKNEKIKFCNFVYRNHIPPRNNFFKKLSKYKHIDSPGVCMNNMPPIGFHKNSIDSRSSEDWAEAKVNFIKPYKFTIACENRIKNGYSTDRIIHAYLAGSIPIYMGDKMIGKDFNTKSFINCNDFRNFDEVVKKVIELDKNDELYEKMLKQPWYNNKNQSRYAKNRIEKRFKEIFGK